jgi:hypothetical protein
VDIETIRTDGVMADAPLYRFLTTEDTIQHGDEFVSDDYKLWEPASGIFIGMRYSAALKTMRRPTTGVPASSIQPSSPSDADAAAKKGTP